MSPRYLGADLPWGDPTRPHGIGMEGMYWRLVDPASGRAVVALCGACRGRCGPWALVAAATQGHAAATTTDGDALAGMGGGPQVRAGGALIADAGRLRVRLDGLALEAAIEPVTPWPRRRPFGALGPAQVIPGLGQYWHPHLPLGRATGTLTLGGTERVALDGWHAYAEKNWGSRFAGDWWWGQAFLGAGASVAFAGGRVHGVSPTALAVALPGGDVVRFGPPTSLMRVAVGPGRWRIRARGPVHAVELEAEAAPDDAVTLPVPVPDTREVVGRSQQHLSGRLSLVVRRGRRVLLRETTEAAGLELGTGTQG